MSDDGQRDCCGSDRSRPQVEAIVSVDERGQLVLPKDLRTKAGIKPGHKLALVAFREGDEICCFTLISADRLVGAVQDTLGPLMGWHGEQG